MIDEVNIYFQKIKYKHLGKQGIISLNYDYETGRFNQLGDDKSNWLTPDKKEISKQINFYEKDSNEAPF
jgi:hypothetical protein